MCSSKAKSTVSTLPALTILTKRLCADKIAEWYELTHKDKYSGEVYLELTFYSNVSITLRLKLTTGCTSCEARRPSTCRRDRACGVFAHAYERLGHELVHSTLRTACESAQSFACSSADTAADLADLAKLCRAWFTSPTVHSIDFRWPASSAALDIVRRR